MTDPAEPTGGKVVETVARVTGMGSSLGFYLTKDLKELGADRGDFVRIRLEKI